MAGFATSELSDALIDRSLMRSMLHVVPATDATEWRPLFAAMMLSQFLSTHRRKVEWVDLAELEQLGRRALKSGPKSFASLGAALSTHWPKSDPASLGTAVRTVVPLVQIPSYGVWNAVAPPTHVPLETWVGRTVEAAPAGLETLVLRGLEAWGPASAKTFKPGAGFAG